jgi:predicted dienelactone hydrolase
MFRQATLRSSIECAKGDVVTYAQRPQYSVEVILAQWNDPARDRAIPVKIYYPGDGGGPFPVIIFSHGLGGTRDTYEYLGRKWASHGYVSVHVQHLGSDYSVLGSAEGDFRQSLELILFDPANGANRTRDVTFAINQMIRMNREAGPLRGKIDATSIGVAGHSFGAMTALQCAGQMAWQQNGNAVSLADPRVAAVVAMSAPVSEQVRTHADATYAAVTVPCLHLTGTHDDGMAAPMPPKYRRIPFDHLAHSDQYLITFNGGDHMVFVGRRLLDRQLPKDHVFHRLILQSTTAFWDAYLKGDSAAKNWLANGGFEATLGADGVFEKKSPP